MAIFYLTFTSNIDATRALPFDRSLRLPCSLVLSSSFQIFPIAQLGDNDPTEEGIQMRAKRTGQKGTAARNVIGTADRAPADDKAFTLVDCASGYCFDRSSGVSYLVKKTS